MVKQYYLRFSSLLAQHAIAVLVVFHVAGVVGLLSPLADLFSKFTPLTLLLSGYLLWLSHRNHTREFHVFILATFCIGFIIEFIGVHYGLLFGNYTYGETLGLKVAGVPVIIGLNWLLIIYCIAVLTDSVTMPVVFKVVLGSLLAVAIDWLIEPVAVHFDFWTWAHGRVPVQNYIGWFFTSALMLIIYHMLRVKAETRMALPYYFIQVFFFLLINLAIR